MEIIDIREIESYNPRNQHVVFRPKYRTQEEKEDVIYMVYDEFGFSTLGAVDDDYWDVAISVFPPILEEEEEWLFVIKYTTMVVPA